MPENSRRANTRIGDARRASITAVLATALREGRIDLAEYERRLVTVQAARVRNDLAQVIADLPSPTGQRDARLRISTVDRDQALVQLAEALTDGRIDAIEYAEAEELLRRAVTYADVDAVVGNLDARASLAERDRSIERIDSAAADGLLDSTDRLGRVAAVRNAATDAQLAALVADLPEATRSIGADAAAPPNRHVPLRASDADREAIAARLHAAVQDGLLDLHEFNERLRAAYAARLRTELSRLVADLPEPGRIAEPPPATPDVDTPPPPPARSPRLAGPGTAVVVLASAGLVVADRGIVAVSLCTAWAIVLAARAAVGRARRSADRRHSIDPREPEPPALGSRLRVEPPRNLSGHRGYVEALTCLVLPDGTPVAISAAADNTAIVWDLDSGTLRHTLSGHTNDLNAVAAMVLPDGAPVVVTASKDGTIRVWDLRDGSPRGELPEPARDIRAIACLTLPDGTPAAIAYGAGKIQMWDLWENRLLRDFDRGSSSDVIVPLVLPGGVPVAVVIGRLDGGDAIEIVSLADGKPRSVLSGHTDSIMAIDAAVLPDGTPVAVSAGWDKTVRIWDLQQGSLLRTFTGLLERKNAVTCLSLPDGTPIVAAIGHDDLHVWNLRDGSELGTLNLLGSVVAGLALRDRTLIVVPVPLYNVAVQALL